METPETGKAHVKTERDVRIHAELWHTSDCLLRAGKERAKGSAHQFRASLAFRAFALEAFLNWIGLQLVPHWKYLERLKPQEKLDLLTDILKVKPDYGSRPWQVVRDLFHFRNTIAHGKPESKETETCVELEHLLNGDTVFIQAKWESFCTETSAVRAQEDVLELANILYNQANLTHEGPRGPFSFGFQTRRAGF
jgi:hypothetical protein